MQGRITKLGNGFGYIRSEGHAEEILFLVGELVGTQFSELKVEDEVDFEFGEIKDPKITDLTAKKVEKLR